MTRKQMTKASVIVVIAMLIAGMAVGYTLPADMQLPVHWNIHGEADRLASKWVALLTPGAVAALVAALFYFLPSMEPRREGLERSQGLYLWGWAAVLMITGVLQIVTMLLAFGYQVPITKVMVGVTGLMLAMIGNQLGKSRSMYMVGIRTPWTLASEEVWIQTHRLAGKLIVPGGIVTLAAALVQAPDLLLFGILAASVLVGTIAPIIYSFILWRREAAK